MLGFIKNLTKKADNAFYLELKDGEEIKPGEAKKKELPAVVTEATTAAIEKAPNAAVATLDASAAAKTTKIEAAKSAKAQKEADAAEKAAMTAKKKELPVEKNFSTKYLLTQSSAERRRPGANMNAFLEMAKGVKTPAQK
jgi:hypothetical protein